MNLVPDLDSFAIYPWAHQDGGRRRSARLICDVYNPDGTPLRRLPAADAEEADGQGRRARLHHGHRPRGGVLPLPARRQRGADRRHARRGRLLRPDARRSRGRGAPRHRARPGADGVRGRGGAPRGRARPARDRLQVRGRRDDRRPRLDLPLHRQEGRDGPRPARDVHAQADLRGQRLGNAHAPVLPGQEAGTTSSTTRRPSTSSRRPPCTTRAASCATRRAFVAITNPLVNSYKRLVPGYEAPVNVAWSMRNRSPLVRVPARRGMGTRIEVRMPDPSCNPYLAFGVMLASGLDGVKNKMDPGEPVDRNVFKMSEREKRRLRIDQLPANLSEALDNLEGRCRQGRARRPHPDALPGGQAGRVGGVHLARPALGDREVPRDVLSEAMGPNTLQAGRSAVLGIV